MKCAAETQAIRASVATSSGCGVVAVHRVARAQQPAVALLDGAAHGGSDPGDLGAPGVWAPMRA